MTTVDRPGTPNEEPWASLSLFDYRRRVAELYGRVRSLPPERAHPVWLEERTDLFRSHPQSPLPPQARPEFAALESFPYNPSLRFEALVAPVEGAEIAISHSGAGTTAARPFGLVEFEVSGRRHHLTLYWLEQYGGGVFLPFRDATNGTATYGGGRYLLDSAKGADLGSAAGRIILDFNFSYHPSCVHDTRWSCPLAPPANLLEAEIRGGEIL